jgi:hypothetical protein
LTPHKQCISKEAVAAYKCACAIRESPIPADPERRQNRQRAFHAASVELERALDRPLGTFDLFDPDDDVPEWLAREGPACIMEFHEVRALRHELERMAARTREVGSSGKADFANERAQVRK